MTYLIQAVGLITAVYSWIDNFYRVCLKSTATPGSDYINASFIDVRKLGHLDVKSM